MPDNHPLPSVSTRPEEGTQAKGNPQQVCPFGDGDVGFRDGDGNYFTDNPLLPGPCSRIEDVFYLQPRPLPPDNLVAAAAKSISALTLQEPDVSSSGEVQSTTLTLQEPDVSSSGEVQSTTSPEELIAPSAQMVPRNTTDCTPSNCYSASSGPTIWYRRPRDWYFMFFIRMDRQGSFHMYPDLGGPFQSLKEVDAAIAHHLDKLKRQAMCNEQDAISFVERLVRRIVFYPDSTPKKGPNSLQRKDPNFRERHFIQAIIDQYNENHSATGDLAHELIGDVKSLWISESTGNYYHFNFTTRVKEAGDVYGCACNLFFAEAMQKERDGDWVVTCFCMIGPNDNGLCYSCFRERPSMKHPENSDAYIAGRIDEYTEFGDDSLRESDDDEETQLTKLRKKFKSRDRVFSKEKAKCLNEATMVKN